MRIGLINENSQADKNQLIFQQLQKAAEPYHHEVLNFGKLSKNDTRAMSYTEIGLQASILIATKTVDFIVTGCGTGQGAAISCNAFPNLICGVITSPLDMYLFGQINAGNAISIAYAEKFGWGSEIELKQIFNECFSHQFGQGYPEVYAESQKKSRERFATIKKCIEPSMLDIYRRFPSKEISEVINYPEFSYFFNKYAEEGEVKNFISGYFNH